MRKFFELRGQLDKHLSLTLGILGYVIIVIGWSMLSAFHMVKAQILPPPWKVLTAIPELHFKYGLVRNLFFSIWENMWGYVEAIAVSVLIGFILGLFPLFRELFSRPINAMRFLPMPAITGILIAICGIETNFKIQFLALGILVYLIPVVVQRIAEVEKVYDYTAITLGGTTWQRILHVYMPSVKSKLIDDIRVLTAISWTYIIVAEMVNCQGGIGYMIWLSGSKQARPDMMYAMLFIIILGGIIQDKIFEKIDKIVNPYKYI